MDLRQTFGNLDVYVFDQLLKGRAPEGARVLDAGCGGGRNVHYLLGAGYDVRGVDQDPEAVQRCAERAAELGREPGRFSLAPVEALPFEDGAFDLVLCSAVLHFARDPEHFTTMVDELWRVLAPGGTLFTRLAMTSGLEGQLQPMERGWYGLPDGSTRFLVSPEQLLEQTRRLGAELLDPLKATLVHGARSMGTWVLGKPA